ncbi:MAG: DUF6933 domain-containing protein, partial [Candidatus Dormibacteria bacterium]
MVLRCTSRLLKLLRVGVSSLVVTPPSGDDWYANLLYVERRKCLLVVHAGTLFPVFEPDVRKAELQPIAPFVVALVERALNAEGLPTDTFGILEPGRVRLAKTASRSVLGCMNDLAYHCRYGAAVDGGLGRCDVAALNRELRRTIHAPQGYVPALEL